MNVKCPQYKEVRKGHYTCNACGTKTCYLTYEDDINLVDNGLKYNDKQADKSNACPHCGGDV
jgi:DNA-directed RNA polymerase subunit RPC12/RpoP